MSRKDEITELVIRIQNGEKDIMPELWGKVERLVAWQANRIVFNLPASAGVTFEDLYNSGYLALDDAIKRYESQSGEFTSLFMLCLKTAFAESSGFRSEKSKNDPLRQMSTGSLDAPLKDTEDMALVDTIVDERNDYEAVEERIYNEQLHEALEQALNTLTPREAEILRHRYYNGETLKEAGTAIGVTAEQARKIEGCAFTSLRRRKNLLSLQQFVEERTPYYMRGSVKSFNTTGMSATEQAVLMREKLREEYTKIEELKARQRLDFEEFCKKASEKHDRIVAEEYASLPKLAI